MATTICYREIDLKGVTLVNNLVLGAVLSIDQLQTCISTHVNELKDLVMTKILDLRSDRTIWEYLFVTSPRDDS